MQFSQHIEADPWPTNKCWVLQVHKKEAKKDSQTLHAPRMSEVASKTLRITGRKQWSVARTHTEWIKVVFFRRAGVQELQGKTPLACHIRQAHQLEQSHIIKLYLSWWMGTELFLYNKALT